MKKALIVHTQHFGRQEWHTLTWECDVDLHGGLIVIDGQEKSYFVAGTWEGYDIVLEEDES